MLKRTCIYTYTHARTHTHTRHGTARQPARELFTHPRIHAVNQTTVSAPLLHHFAAILQAISSADPSIPPPRAARACPTVVAAGLKRPPYLPPPPGGGEMRPRAVHTRQAPPVWLHHHRGARSPPHPPSPPRVATEKYSAKKRPIYGSRLADRATHVRTHARSTEKLPTYLHGRKNAAERVCIADYHDGPVRT